VQKISSEEINLDVPDFFFEALDEYIIPQIDEMESERLMWREGCDQKRSRKKWLSTLFCAGVCVRPRR